MALGEVADATRNRKFQRGIKVVTSAELTYQLTGSNMSSPQTAELNAGARAPTIDKWVRITHWEAMGWIAFLCWLYGDFWPVVGGGLAWSGMYGKYRYAITSGLQNGGPPTENYKFNGGSNGSTHRAAGRTR